jgi:ribosomal protein S18 acetylase RimI-like enzyme
MTEPADRYDFRQATIADAYDLGTLHVAVWQQTYAGVMDAEFLESLDVDAWRADWVRQLTDDHDTRVFVARDRQDNNRLVGFTSTGPARDQPAPRPQELYVLNVDRSCHGSGVAQRLINLAITNTPAYLWVVEGNDRAANFYRKFGFEMQTQLKWDAKSQTNDVLMTRDTFNPSA